MKKLLLYSTGGFGDALVFTHLATLLKETEKYKNHQIDFCVNHDFGFQFGNGNNNDAFEILKIQNNITDFVIFNRFEGTFTYPTGEIISVKTDSPYEHIYLQRDFYSDLGYIKSLFIEFIEEFGIVPNLGETNFRLWTDNVPTIKEPIKHIALPGELDWKNKWPGQEHKVKEIYKILTDRQYTIEIIGPETGKSYLNNLRALESCNLYIGPFGSIGHAAAGLGIDTITLSSIYSPIWDNPAFYHSGFHKGIVCAHSGHCGTFKCITPKYYYPKDPDPLFYGPPVIEWNTPWIENCPYTKNGKSCVSNVEVQEFITALDQWEELNGIRNS